VGWWRGYLFDFIVFVGGRESYAPKFDIPRSRNPDIFFADMVNLCPASPES
jgi:hypothetical protein